MAEDDDTRLIRQWYAGALQRDPEERGEYLDRVCVDRPDLRPLVEALLEKHSGIFDQKTSSPDDTHLELSPPAGSETAGRKVGSYNILRELGRGGMGVVYLADDTRLARRVALKAIGAGYSRTPAFRDRLRNEAKVAAGLSHPGIATVYALEEIDGDLYLACEYVPGPALRALVDAGRLPIEQVVDIGVQLARALAEAHAKRIVHRDIKPENAIKTPSGVVKILDFGLARDEQSAQARMTQTGTIMGTPAYLSPEQAQGKPTDFRTDLFALGLLLYELASGSNPFVNRNVSVTIAKIIEEDPPPLSDVRPHCPPALDHVIMKCLRKKPDERYGATREVVADLERLHAELARMPFESTTDAWPRLASTASRHRWLIIHQIAVSAAYIGMLYPTWYASRWLQPPWSTLFLLGVLASVAVATTLRLHLWFMAMQLPHELAAQQAQTWRWTRWCDVGFAAAQVSAAIAIGGGHPEFAMLFVGVAMAALVASFVIEPATARATVGGRQATP
jgi:serine/threonine protein kinase